MSKRERTHWATKKHKDGELESLLHKDLCQTLKQLPNSLAVKSIELKRKRTFKGGY